MSKVTKIPRLVPVRDEAALQAAGIDIKPQRLRRKKCEGWHPRVFVTRDRLLYIDLDVYENEVIRPALAARDARAEKIERLRRTA